MSYSEARKKGSGHMDRVAPIVQQTVLFEGTGKLFRAYGLSKALEVG